MVTTVYAGPSNVVIVICPSGGVYFNAFSNIFMNNRIKGSPSSQIVKTVPRSPPKPLLKAFVGRMVSETTEDDLRTSLTEAGLTVVHCRKLKAPEGKSFKTAAFYVGCSVDCKDLFYKEETWPEGSELRDWYETA